MSAGRTINAQEFQVAVVSKRRGDHKVVENECGGRCKKLGGESCGFGLGGAVTLCDGENMSIASQLIVQPHT